MVYPDVSARQRPGRIVRRIAGSLRWQLTISYALVTLAAALALSIASAAVQVSRGEVSVDRAGAPRILEKDAARAALYLSAAAPVPDVARFWVAVPAVDDLAGQAPAGRRVTVAVFDASGHLVAADNCTSRQYTGLSAASCRAAADARAAMLLASPAGRRAVASALRGTSGQPITGDAAGHGFVAAAVPGADKQPVGVLVAIFPGRVPAAPQQSALGAFFAAWTETWPREWIPLVFATLVLGTAIGLLLSHRLVRRMRSMAAIVRTWSRGDLAPSIDARGGGELGRLGADLDQMAEQLRNLLRARAEIARREERRRLQRDLHDGIKQELFATAMHLAAARALLHDGDTRAVPGVADSLEKAQGSARRAQQEVRALLDGLPPQPLARGDFCGALAEIARQFEEQTGIAVALSAPPELHLAAGTGEAMTRVIQEALTNIRRHAEATRVAIRLTAGDGLFRVRVEDNGHGFPVASHSRRGLGLTFMRERVESLGGELTIDSGETGTSIDATLPAESRRGAP
ncbi:MAG: sensor histidine kinase [Chloroflexi bacterium]|nr:sensor histidine kinase [Chloroflexota bacterium]